MNFRHLRFTLFTVFFIAAALFYSCTKIITTDIGGDLLPPADDIITKDMVIDIATKNMRYDSVAVGISDDHVLGYLNDPIFGKTTASINFQVAPPSTPFTRGIPKENVVVDSVVLCLKYDGAWGDTNQLLRVRVFSMDPEVIFSSALVYNNTKTFTKGQELTESNTPKDVDIRALDDVDTTKGYFTEVATNQLRIRLNKSFGEKILQADSATYYTSDTAFNNLLRGIIVQPETTTGQALISINLTDTTTRLALYYHNSNPADTVKLSKRFAPSTLTSANANTILRNYAGTKVDEYINKPDSSQDLIYMQTSPGTRAFINVSKLDSMPNVIVHRAELLMYQVPDESDKYLTPPNLFLAAYDEDSMRAFTIPHDISFSGGGISNLAQFGVTPRKKDNTYYYSFDISRYVQGIVTRHEKIYNLTLMAPYNQYIFIDSSFNYAVPISSPVLNTVGVGRVRLGGGNNSNSQYKMRLHIVYSEVQ